jgi:hypothetical protein
MQPQPHVPVATGFRPLRPNPHALRTLRRAAPRRVFGDT